MHSACTSWDFEKVECTFNSWAQGDWKSFYGYWNKTVTDYFYSTVQVKYSGRDYEGIGCYVLLTPPLTPSTVIPLYRYWNNSDKDYFYTTTSGNYSVYIYVYKTIACYVEP